MQRGSSFRLSGKILVLECVRNLLSSINDSDQGLELEIFYAVLVTVVVLQKSSIYASCRPFDDPPTQLSFLKYLSISVVGSCACWSNPTKQSWLNLSVAYSKEDLVQG